MNLTREKITTEEERNICNNILERVKEEVLLKINDEACFRSLKNIGKKEICDFTAASIPPSEKIEQVRLCYSKINVLTATVFHAIQSIVEEKLENPSLYNEVKAEVLKCLKEKQSPSSSYHSNHMADASDALPEVKTEMEEDGESSFEDAISEVSSVHTSDLSCFEDEISISSDEETGTKRKRISLKLAEETIKKKKVLEESKMHAAKEEEDTYDATHPKTSSDSQGLTQKSLPPRVRKPNAKYASNDIISPFNVKEKDFEDMLNENTASSSAENISSVSRKVGRPRKNPPDV